MRSAKPATTCRDGAETLRLSFGAAWSARRSVRGAGRDRIVEAAARLVGSKAPLGLPRARAVSIRRAPIGHSVWLSLIR